LHKRQDISVLTKIPEFLDKKADIGGFHAVLKSEVKLLLSVLYGADAFCPEVADWVMSNLTMIVPAHHYALQRFSVMTRERYNRVDFLEVLTHLK